MRALRSSAVGIAGSALVVGLSSCGAVAQSSPSLSASARTAPAVAAPVPTPSAPSVLHASMASWSLPAPLSRMVVLADGSRLLIAGGLDASGTSTRAVLVANPATRQVSSYGNLAVGVHDAGGAMLAGIGYIFGGGRSSSTRGVQALRPGAQASIVGNLPIARADLSVVSTGSGALVVGGFDGTSATRTVLSTSDGIHFRTIAELQAPVRYAAAAAVGDSLFVFGGEWSSRATAAIQRVSISTGNVGSIGQLPANLSHAAAMVFGGQIWLVGGISQGRTSNQIIRFDPVSGGIMAAGILPEAVSDAGLAVTNGAAYLVGGDRSSGAPTTGVVELTLSP